MNTTAIYIKTEPALKKRAQEIATELGFSLSSLMNAWLKQLIRTKTVNFHITDAQPSEYLIKMVKDSDSEYKHGKTSPAFKTGEEAVEWLEKQGI